jgi:hypothetical protein
MELRMWCEQEVHVPGVLLMLWAQMHRFLSSEKYVELLWMCTVLQMVRTGPPIGDDPEIMTLIITEILPPPGH